MQNDKNRPKKRRVQARQRWAGQDQVFQDTTWSGEARMRV